MKEETKKILGDLGDILGYLSAIGLVGSVEYILYEIYKHGGWCFNEPNPFMLFSEIGLAGGIIGFLLYKLVNEIKKRHSI